MKTSGMMATLATVILTAKLGTVQYDGHKETYYNLPMHNIVSRADEFYGLEDVYEVREDGVKTYNGFVMLATDWGEYPFGSVIETSLGTGIVLDMQTTGNKQIVDIAVTW